ncbi:hypothetical protein PLANPX_1021 [Lacipirellula parvula]|uniref:Uncharacterized protein n=1 Tax=Lacipirellula parvula TaxID=2650471 RepID=A0A5K7XEI4_9BACT|nr:hypothetical protein PLANPX_1021 [Lacipirellula parvula]
MRIEGGKFSGVPCKVAAAGNVRERSLQRVRSAQPYATPGLLFPVSEATRAKTTTDCHRLVFLLDAKALL